MQLQNSVRSSGQRLTKLTWTNPHSSPPLILARERNRGDDLNRMAHERGHVRRTSVSSHATPWGPRQCATQAHE